MIQHLIPISALALVLLLSGCGAQTPMPGSQEPEGATTVETTFTVDTPIQTVMDDPAFGDYGRLLFPTDDGYWSGETLGDLRLTFYSHIDPSETVEIVNTLKERALAGETIFYNIYTADPDKEDTGLFFFKGEPGARFAVCNAGGAFAYVGAMHDSFPHALELSKQSYNAFALIYRPGAQTACEDLARAIAFLHEHAEELDIYEEENRGGRWLRTWLLVMLVLIILVCMSLRITDIRVIGNTTYTEEEARDLVFDSAYELNPIYCFVRNTFFEHKELPFVEDYDIRFRSPFSCDLIIYEKRIVGYLDYMSSYMYFDRDGIVVEASETKTEGIPEITGIDFNQVVLYEALPVENQDIFREILSITQILSKYGLSADKIYFDDSGEMTLYFGDIRARLGSEENMEEKVARLQQLLPSAEGKKGVFRLENYSGSGENVSFELDD